MSAPLQQRPWRAAARARLRAATTAFALVLVATLGSCSTSSDLRIGRVLPEPTPNLPGTAGDASATEASSTACTSRPLAAQEPTLAIYFVLDRSASMRSSVLSLDKWAPITYALGNWVDTTAPPAIDSGLVYYPADDRGMCSCNMPRCGNCRDPRSICSPGAYEPDVPLGQQRRLSDSLDQHSPVTGGNAAPLAPAIERSEDYLHGWQDGQPRKKAIRVIIAAGLTTFDGCFGDGGSSDATSLVGRSDFRTYVISLASDNGALDRVAAAGGTGHAFFLDIEHDPTGVLAAHMKTILEREAGCDFLVPEGFSDRDVRLNVALLSPPDAPVPVEVNSVRDRQDCRGDWSWYRTMARLSLCDLTCSKLHTQRPGQTAVASVGTRCDPDAPTR